MNWPKDDVPMSEHEAEYGIIIMNEFMWSMKLIAISVFQFTVC